MSKTAGSLGGKSALSKVSKNTKTYSEIEAEEAIEE